MSHLAACKNMSLEELDSVIHVDQIQFVTWKSLTALQVKTPFFYCCRLSVRKYTYVFTLIPTN